MQQIKLAGVGADCEVFLQRKATGQIISAEGYIKGSKEHPYRYDDNPYRSTQLDNVLAEYTIQPAGNREDFYYQSQHGLKYINSIIPKGLCTAVLPSANLDEMFLQTEQAQVFGCEPDLNAYLQWVNPSPRCEDRTLRSCGGHIHLGYNCDYPAFDLKDLSKDVVAQDVTRRNIVKALDLFVSVPNVIVEPDSKRKELYGKAGAYRPKEYGLEYRTISNFYLASKELTLFVYDNVIKAVEWLNKEGEIDSAISAFVQKTINHNDKSGARELIKHFNLNLV